MGEWGGKKKKLRGNGETEKKRERGGIRGGNSGAEGEMGRT